MILYIIIEVLSLVLAFMVGYETRYLKEIKALEEVLNEEE